MMAIPCTSTLCNKMYHVMRKKLINETKTQTHGWYVRLDMNAKGLFFSFNPCMTHTD